MPRTLWSVGGYGSKVAVVRREDSPHLHLRWGRKHWRSLGHSDLPAAKQAARDQSAILVVGRRARNNHGPISLGGLLALYVDQVTPGKSDLAQRDDARRVQLWTHVLGADSDPLALTGAQLKAFERRRRKGLEVPGLDLRPAGAKTVREDLAFLRAVFNWAAGMESGWLLEKNPMAGYKLPVELNPRRPRLYFEDYTALLEVAPGIHPRLYPLLVLAESLGWRISALCQLRPTDLDRERTKTRPHGRLLKRAETDKVGVERWTIIPVEARQALEDLMPGKGGWLFPADRKKGRPFSRHFARKLLYEAWKQSGVPEERWTGWHAFRRKWVDERDHLPDHVVAAQGAWLSPRTLDIYRAPAEDALLEAATTTRKLRRHALDRANATELPEDVQQNVSGKERGPTTVSR